MTNRQWEIPLKLKHYVKALDIQYVWLEAVHWSCGDQAETGYIYVVDDVVRVLSGEFRYGYPINDLIYRPNGGHWIRGRFGPNDTDVIFDWTVEQEYKIPLYKLDEAKSVLRSGAAIFSDWLEDNLIP